MTTARAGENVVDPQRSFYRWVMPFVVSFHRSFTNILASNYTVSIIVAMDLKFY